MPIKKKSWKEQLQDAKGLPRIEPIGKKRAKQVGEGTMVIPSPLEVDELIKRVPAGKLITLQEIQEELAKRHNTTIACPTTTGIFAWIAAYAAEEGAIDRTNLTPYWRVLKSDGELNPNYPGGYGNLITHLENEGHVIDKKGKTYYVKDYKDYLVTKF